MDVHGDPDPSARVYLKVLRQPDWIFQLHAPLVVRVSGPSNEDVSGLTSR